MAQLILGGIFVMLVLIVHAISLGFTGKPAHERTMRAMFYCVVSSAVLVLFVLFAVKSGIAAMTPLALIFWAYAMLMSILLGVIGFIGAIVLWMMQKINPTSKTRVANPANDTGY